MTGQEDHRIEGLNLQPGETAVITASDPISSDQARRIKLQFEDSFPENPVIVVSDSLKVDAVRDLVFARVAKQLVDMTADGWVLVRMRLVENDSGIYDLQVRTD